MIVDLPLPDVIVIYCTIIALQLIPLAWTLWREQREQTKQQFKESKAAKPGKRRPRRRNRARNFDPRGQG